MKKVADFLTEKEERRAFPRHPEKIGNTPTRYEVSVDGVIVGYDAKKTKATLFKMAQANSDLILRHFPGGEDFPLKYTKGYWIFGNKIIVKFTGRTEKSAYWEDNGFPKKD